MPFLNCGHFLLIHGNTIKRDDVAKKFYRRLLECAFLIFGVKTVFLKSWKHQADMLLMGIEIRGVDENVI